MDLAIMNNSLEYAMQTSKQEVNYNDNFQSPTWSSSDIISNNEELISFIGDNNFNLQFMDTLDKLNSPKIDKESDIRESLVEFLQEQFKTEAHINNWTDFDVSSTIPSPFYSNSSEYKSPSSFEKVQDFKCNVCCYVSSNEAEFNDHSRTHLVQNYNSDPLSFYKCFTADLLHNDTINNCSVPFVNTLNEDAQLNDHFKCKICSYITEKLCKLKVHMLTHSSNKNVICEVCDLQVSRTTYSIHIKQHAVLSFQCPLCCYTASDESTLSKHIAVHKGTNECIVCNTPTSLDQQTPTSNNFSCTVCKYTTKHLSYIQRHLLTHNSKTIYQCYLCDYKTAHKKMIAEHCSKHSGVYIQCNLCDFKTVYRNNFKTHQKMHSGERKFVCDVCGFKFAQNSNLKAHLATHLGEKNYECHLCDYKATQKINLKAHIITHVGESDLACNVCNYKALNRSVLKTHMTVHNTEKVFECNICDYKTAHKSGLRRHLQVHTGEKKYLCDICDYKTSRKDYINRHMLKHTGEKNFRCNFCDYKTAYRNSLNVHVALVHATDI